MQNEPAERPGKSGTGWKGELFRIRNLRFSYSSEIGTGGFSLSIDDLPVEEGKITVLTGVNGSGKTTLLRLLNGLDGPFTGTIQYRGKPVPGEGLSLMRRESALVHQKPYLFRDTVYGNASYGLKIRKISKFLAHVKTMEALRDLGLEKFIHRRARSLSGGEKQRLAVARALAISPGLLILDEPTGNIDPVSTFLIEKLIKKKVSGGMTVLMTTHNLSSCYRLADTIIPMAEGSPETLPVNVLKGEVEERDHSFVYFRTGDALLHCPSMDGDFSVAVIPLDDVILSKQRIETSARNMLRGRVVSIEPAGTSASTRSGLPTFHGADSHGLHRITVDCGAPIRALITQRSLEELSLHPETEIHVTFKASAVRLY